MDVVLVDKVDNPVLDEEEDGEDAEIEEAEGEVAENEDAENEDDNSENKNEVKTIIDDKGINKNEVKTVVEENSIKKRIDANLRKKIIVSEEDKDLLGLCSYQVSKDNYAHAKMHGGKGWLLHRYICENRIGMTIKTDKGAPIIINHINGNRLDNRRENLELSNAQSNATNRLKQQGTKSYSAFNKLV